MQSNCKGPQSYGVVTIMHLVFLVFLIHADAVRPKKSHSAPVHSAQEYAQVRIIRHEATHVEIIVYLTFITLYMFMCTCTINLM